MAVSLNNTKYKMSTGLKIISDTILGLHSFWQKLNFEFGAELDHPTESSTQKNANCDK